VIVKKMETSPEMTVVRIPSYVCPIRAYTSRTLVRGRDTRMR